MFSITTDRIDPAALKAHVLDPSCGAISSFEGLVRNHHQGRSVEKLDYEAHPILAEKEGLKVLAEAIQKFGITRAVACHRIGSLAIGEIAIAVHVSAPHRADAFDACQFLIDEIKHRVPIWKREFYSDGTTAWVEQCDGCSQGQH